VSTRLSVPAWARSKKPAAVGLLLWARRTGDIDRLLAARRAAASAGSGARVVGVVLLTCSVFTARCYASAVLAMGLCLSVCLSGRHKSVFYRNG